MPPSVPAFTAPVIEPAVSVTLPGAPAPEAGEVSFEAVLAAQLAALAGSSREPAVILTAAEDSLEPDGTAAAPEVPDLAAHAVDGSASTSAPVQLPIQLPALPALAAAQPAADQALPVPELDPSIRPAPSLLDLPARASAARPTPDLPEAARIAGPSADPVVQRPAPSSSVPLHAGDLSAAAQATPTHGQEAEAAVTLVAVGTQRGENVRAAQPVRLDVGAPVGSRDFGQEVGNRLVWMATHNRQVAELRIDPPQLGPVEVRLSISNDQASLSFHSPHATVRDALQASLPRLQDMLQGLGINLDQVSVSAEGFGQGASGRGAFQQGWPGAHGHALPGHASAASDHQEASAGMAVAPLRAGVGVIDVYA
jgi:flagellar hook-length control protein FliK